MSHLTISKQFMCVKHLAYLFSIAFQQHKPKLYKHITYVTIDNRI